MALFAGLAERRARWGRCSGYLSVEAVGILPASFLRVAVVEYHDGGLADRHLEVV
jgi:hypothetical protein